MIAKIITALQWVLSKLMFYITTDIINTGVSIAIAAIAWRGLRTWKNKIKLDENNKLIKVSDETYLKMSAWLEEFRMMKISMASHHDLRGYDGLKDFYKDGSKRRFFANRLSGQEPLVTNSLVNLRVHTISNDEQIPKYFYNVMEEIYLRLINATRFLNICETVNFDDDLVKKCAASIYEYNEEECKTNLEAAYKEIITYATKNRKRILK